MKALTLWQPWATLVAAGIKTIETRSWRTSYRGPLAIHAAAREPKAGEVVAGGMVSSHRIEYHDRVDEGWHWRAWGDGQPLHRLPAGAIVAVCQLVDCLPMKGPGEVVGPSIYVPGPTSTEDRPAGTLWTWQRPWGENPHPYLPWADVTDQLPYGDYAPGRFGWLLENIEPLAQPVPARGKQGLWEWDERPWLPALAS